MTYRVYFYAEQAFLSQTRQLLQNKDPDKEQEIACVCILACASAIEAVVNDLLSKQIKFRHFDELRITSKIEYIQLFGGAEPNWGVEPWQSVSRLIKIRNWLAHYKDSDIGLVNSDFDWLTDESNSRPKLDPYAELTFDRAQKYYDTSRAALFSLSTHAGANQDRFDYLLTEHYEPFLVG